MTTSTRVKPPGLSHSALFYRSEPEYLDAVVPFVLDGLCNDEPVLVAVPERKRAVLRTALGSACQKVTLADLTDGGRNPGRILTCW
ncbi:MEthanogen/methylotroph, DcmR Sensory domain protein [Mycobacterium kansasii 732]|uniref:MEDS domain-containing protein n=1 Tax=Mycobacterium pseudokansasii TaxID=2341080 RepID=A0A498R1F7_9MYCO|nr:MEDS domain-containing protein [Mycobacterium pseudokansasii]EUA08059.1 MEthanogen/methylotroph, DcmR Sensory domain protein [Mycobacterium kansasii 732]KZS66096.1 hypothetical protein A4G27_13425 [Mycobacterium kansasii]MBY0389672.1 MEDS domain-containing protein [Mycobacterium pseudokansasii]VAZ86989.1 hypothetical protein LAUMK35_00062 [Mycobacterium pseudokansasii]VAZ87364.1 hypothetical protein LAUMK21_00061 [Mycobacterium pseudokansasii]